MEMEKRDQEQGRERRQWKRKDGRRSAAICNKANRHSKAIVETWYEYLDDGPDGPPLRGPGTP
jgi:hypothetical protein